MLFLELATDVWLRIFEYLSPSARRSLEQTCSTMYAFSLDCSVPWYVSDKDEWYWGSPLPIEYEIHRRGVGKVKIRRKVVATCTTHMTKKKLYWKGEEKLTLREPWTYSLPMNIEWIALPRECVLEGKFEDHDVEYDLPSNHPMQAMVANPVSSWNQWYRQILDQFFPHIQGPWSTVHFTARLKDGKWIDCSITHLYWKLIRGNNDLLWNHRDKWLPHGIAFQTDFFQGVETLDEFATVAHACLLFGVVKQIERKKWLFKPSTGGCG